MHSSEGGARSRINSMSVRNAHCVLSSAADGSMWVEFCYALTLSIIVDTVNPNRSWSITINYSETKSDDSTDSFTPSISKLLFYQRAMLSICTIRFGYLKLHFLSLHWVFSSYTFFRSNSSADKPSRHCESMQSHYQTQIIGFTVSKRAASISLLLSDRKYWEVGRICG